MLSKTFSIPAVNSQMEVDRIVGTVAAMPGVQRAKGHLPTRLFTITWNAPATLEGVGHVISGLGYTPAMK